MLLSIRILALAGKWAHLRLGDRSQLARRRGLATDSTNSDVDGLADSPAGSVPVPDFLRDDLNDRNTRVVLVALVNSIAEVTEPGCRAMEP